LAEDAALADTFLSRMVGLLRHKELPRGKALIITRCNSIHMWFMRFAIDVVFVDKKNIVVGLVRGIRPFRLSPIFFRAASAIELSEGSIDRSQTRQGDRIIFQEIEKSPIQPI